MELQERSRHLASEHQSTAALEVFVHNKPSAPTKSTRLSLGMADSFTERFSAEKCQTIGGFCRRRRKRGDRRPLGSRATFRSVGLASVISPVDTNFLLNPEHRDFKRVRIAQPVDYDFDPRLLNLRISWNTCRRSR